MHGSAPAYAQQPIDSVAMVVVQSTGSKGTGWLVADRMLVTNEHVIRNGAPNAIVAQFPDGSTHPVAKIAAVDGVLDLAVLELQSSPSATPLKIDPSPVSVGAQVYALGFPLAYNGPAPLMIVGYVAGFEGRVLKAGAGAQQRAVRPGREGLGRGSVGRVAHLGALTTARSRRRAGWEVPEPHGGRALAAAEAER
jgi:hypothetical protein